MPDELGGLAGGVVAAQEVIGAEFLVWGCPVEDVVDDHQDRVGDGDGGAARIHGAP